MKIKRSIPILLLMFCAACAGAGNMDFAQNNTPLATAARAISPVPTATATIEPTATIDYQQTAVIAKETSDEAMRINVEVTAEQDRRIFVQAQWTVTAEAINYANANMTQQASQFTATAYATSIPATQTAQSMESMVRGTERAMTITAPTQMVAMANARAVSETATFRAQVDAFVVLCVGVAMVLIGAGIFLMVYFDVQVKTKAPKIVEKDIPVPIPFVHVAGPQSDKGGVRMIRAEVPCTIEQLLELADGIVNRGMTLAFGQWEDTIVHKSLKELRAFFVQHEFAKVLLGKGGELGIEVLGEEFLQDCISYQRPPLPYVCIPIVPIIASQA
jgi:hypothetical protein